MEEENNFSEYFASSSNIFHFALKKWKFLLGVLVLSALMSGVLSGPKFITPKYESTAVIYPANLGAYSGETRIEQMQQYLQSNELRNYIIDKLSLYEEYDIDTSYVHAKRKIINEYQKHITFEETRYESIEITAQSTNPEKAKKIADEIINQLDNIIRKTERKKYYEHVVINKRLLDEKQNQIDSLQNIITEYSTKYGILDYLVQTEMVTEGYLEFLLEGKKGEDYEKVEELYDNLKKYGRQYHNINGHLNAALVEHSRRLIEYEKAFKSYTMVLSHSYVLVSPEIPDEKVYPIRWLIVLTASISATFLAFILFIILGLRKQL